MPEEERTASQTTKKGERTVANLAIPNNQLDQIKALAAQETVPTRYAEVIEQGDWAAMPRDEREAVLTYFAERERETLEGLGQLRFPLIKFPSAGASFFELQDASGEPIAVKTLEGTVVYKARGRAIWLDESSQPNFEIKKGVPPTCRSTDGIRPDPTSDVQAKFCADCRWNQWKTGRDGRGKACKERLNLFLVNGMEEIPSVFPVPPTSLQAFNDYAMQIKKQTNLVGGLAGVVTKFGLEDAVNQDGKEYKTLTCAAGKPLKYQQHKHVEAILKQFQAQMAARGVQSEEAAVEEPAPQGDTPF